MRRTDTQTQRFLPTSDINSRMATAGVFQIVSGSKAVNVFGRHDAYEDGWPAWVVKYISDNSQKPVDELANEIVEVLRKQDYELYREVLRGREGYDEDRLKRMADSNFFVVSDRESVPPWEYWYVYDVNKNEVVVKTKEPKPCPDRDDISCGYEVVEEFRGSPKEFLAKYLLGTK